MKKLCGICCIAGALILISVLAAYRLGQSPVTSLEILPDSFSLAPGDSMQLYAGGDTKDGDSATEQELEALDLLWRFHSEDNAFTVSEDGVLTAISPGTGNISVQSGDGKLTSRAITVYVK